MRYCMNFYLNWHKNCERSKLNMCFLLSKFESSNSDLSQVLSLPVEVEVHTVPNFKAAVNGIVES